MRALALVVLGLLPACVLSRPMAVPPPPMPVRAAPPLPGRVEPPPLAEAWSEIGRSVRQRPIEARTIGRGPRKVLWVGGIHGTEREGWVATERLAEAFLAEPGLADLVTLHMIRDVNPDGSAAGTRGNANGVDLNRNFPAANFRPSRDRGRAPLDQPESALLHDWIERLDPELMIVAHSARARKFINYDGPAAAVAETFAARSGFPIVESDRLHGTPGSLGSWVGIDRGAAILTLEYHNGQDPYAAWEETRDAILAAIAGP